MNEQAADTPAAQGVPQQEAEPAPQQLSAIPDEFLGNWIEYADDMLIKEMTVREGEFVSSVRSAEDSSSTRRSYVVKGVHRTGVEVVVVAVDQGGAEHSATWVLGIDDRFVITHPEELLASFKRTPVDEYHPPQTFAGLREEAGQVVAELLARFPSDAEAFATAAQLSGVFGEKELEVQYWATCLELAPRFMSARYALTWFALREGEFDEMVNQSRQALAVSPDAPVFRDLLGRALIELGKPIEAVGVLQQNVDQGTATCDTYTLLGKTCLVRKDYQQAADYFEKALDNDPNWSKTIYGLATAHTRIGRTREAKKSFEKFKQMQTKQVVISGEGQLITACRDVATVYRNIAKLYARARDSLNSERLLRRSVKLDPSGTAGPQALQSILDQVKH